MCCTPKQMHLHTFHDTIHRVTVSITAQLLCMCHWVIIAFTCQLHFFPMNCEKCTNTPKQHSTAVIVTSLKCTSSKSFVDENSIWPIRWLHCFFGWVYVSTQRIKMIIMKIASISMPNIFRMKFSHAITFAYSFFTTNSINTLLRAHRYQFIPWWYDPFRTSVWMWS